jgi:prevent-host-death family protein
VFVDDSNQKGNVAELAIAAEAARLDISVLKPMTEHERYDLAFELGGRFIRVQCKWAALDGDVVRVHLGRTRRGPNGFIRRTYSEAEIDAIGAYCGELHRCFLIPWAVIAGQWAIQMRLAPARNGQRAAVHFAADYELGAVAQLEERRHGMAEVGGSSPPSSTTSAGDVSGAEIVGAHIFRNHFGWYMQRAAAGEEFLVTRRGHPFARLSPPEPQLPGLRSP